MHVLGLTDELCKKLAGVPTITSYRSLSISPLYGSQINGV